MTYVLKDFVDSVNNFLVVIQGFSTLLNVQKVRLEKLVKELKEDASVDGPSQFEQEEESVVSGLYCVTYNE